MTRTAASERALRRWVLPRYLVSAAAARIADEGARVSLVLLALHGTGSAAVGGVMIAALLLPHVVAAPLVGVMVDRARHPGWVLGAAVLIFAGSLFSAAVLLGHAPLWVVFVLLLVGGCCGPAITGGLTSQLPGLVGEEAAPRAFGLDSLLYNAASMAGPALAGITAAATSPVAAQCLLAAFAAFGAVGIATLPIVAHRQLAEAARPSLLSGATEILRQPTLRVVTLSSTLGQLGPGALAVVAAVLATSLNRPASSGLLLSAIAAGSFLGSLLWTWHPIAPDRSPLVMTVSMIGIGVPIALAAAAASIEGTAALFALSGVFVGPFGAALFTARTQYSTEAVRTQVFTIGAGLKVTASAFGAALIGLATGLPIWTQLLLVASSPLLAGVLGTVLLTHSAARRHRHVWSPLSPAPTTAPSDHD
jgi:MFS family permease